MLRARMALSVLLVVVTSETAEGADFGLISGDIESRMDKMANEIDQLNSEVDLLHLQLSNAEAKIFDLEQHQRIADYAQQLANIPDLMRLAKEHPELKKDIDAAIRQMLGQH